jgi:hypothetical protein
MPISKILELYARCGRSLAEKGLHEAALPLSEASTALTLFAQQRWLVLGGDVYTQTDSGQFESTYENWFYEGKNAEDSVSVARHFMDGLAGRGVHVVFVLEGRG